MTVQRSDKVVMPARAGAVLRAIRAEPSHDARGRPTVILTRGAWTREVPVARLREAFDEIKREAATNDLNWPTGRRASGCFHRVRAQLAALGIALWRTDAEDGAVQFISERASRLRRHNSLVAVQQHYDATDGAARAQEPVQGQDGS